MSGGIKVFYEKDEIRARDDRAVSFVEALGRKSVVLVGLMGCGKTSIGRRLAHRLGLEFIDADIEIEAAAGMSISDIFAQHGEVYFRDGERRVMQRLLSDGPRVVATGGGAFMNAETRARIKENGISVWLKAELDILWRRVKKRSHRPLLQNADPEKTLRDLMELRYPVYERADITVVSQDGPYETSVEAVFQALEFFMRFSADVPADPLTVSVPADPFQLPPNLPLPLKVRVELGAEDYDILIGKGLLGEAARHILALAPKARCAIVTDENLAKIHLAGLERALSEANIGFSTLVLPPGEASKSFPVFQQICESVIKAKLERGDLILALGGGVIGDLAGFAAACVRRGMRFVQIPTSLLAQVDSSVGGKTGINSSEGKNLIGAFHQPSLVLADTGVLETLPVREFKAGYAEIVKYGAIGDERFFAWLEGNWRGVFGLGPELAMAIAHSCAAKAGVVARDEHETGERALLNFGHTFGHALENLTHYDSEQLVHGEGVAIGMACAFRFSVYLGLCAKEDQMRFEAHLHAAGLPIRIGEIKGFSAGAAHIVAAMAQDKKVERGALTFILAHRIGECFIAKGVEAEKVQAFLTEDLKRA